MKRSWKSTLGGALSALGTSLVGVGVVPQLSGMPSQTLTRVALAGFVFQALGQFFGHLFAADADVVTKAIQNGNGHAAMDGSKQP